MISAVDDKQLPMTLNRNRVWVANRNLHNRELKDPLARMLIRMKDPPFRTDGTDR